MNLSTTVINLFAGPGAGKSTTAAGLYYTLKRRNKSVELVTEYAKDRVWEEHHTIFSDQLYILAKQNRKLRRLQGKVDYVITDSPLLLGQYYAPLEDKRAIKFMTEWAFNQYTNLNIYLKRTKPYDTNGRNESFEEALKADEGIRDIVKWYDYLELEDSSSLVTELADYLERVQ